MTGAVGKDELRSAYLNALMDAPSVAWEGRCSVCGMRATNHHHVIAKGMGGTRFERRIPTVLLCGGGNSGGCHGMVHARRLHLHWCAERGGWLFCFTEPMGDMEAWMAYGDDYAALPGWERMRSQAGPVYGRG